MDSLIEAFSSPAFEIANVTFWLNLRNATVAFLLFTVLNFLILRVGDRLSGINLKKSMDLIEQDPQALAHYFGERHKALAISGAIIIAAAFVL